MVGRDRCTPASAKGGPRRWRWLEDTYWYVPTSGLPAYVFSAGNSEPRRTLDQTVYHIADYRNGYFWRNVVERCVNRLKHWRGIATRYEKRALNYRAMVVIAALIMWLAS